MGVELRYLGATGYPAAFQPFHPPLSTQMFSNPARFMIRATRALVCSAGQAQYTTIRSFRS
jgi:hypothetical protein